MEFTKGYDICYIKNIVPPVSLVVIFVLCLSSLTVNCLMLSPEPSP